MITEITLAQSRNSFRKLLNKQQMKGTFTFTDGASNQTNLTKLPKLEVEGSKLSFTENLIKKVKQLFVQEEICEPVVESLFIEESVNAKPIHITSQEVVPEAVIPVVVVKEKPHSSHINYQLNIQQMNLFTYLRRAITSSDESLSGQFLEQFKSFLSVIVGTAPDKNAPLGSVKRDFGILSYLGGSQLLGSKIISYKSMRSWASVLFLTLLTASGTLAQVATSSAITDLSVKKTIDNQSPTLGQEVTYTVKVRNDGNVAATGVELTDVMPVGATFKTVSVSAGSTTNATDANGITTIKWNVGTVAGTVGTTVTELTMTVKATVKLRGLHFNIAEITKENEAELDSKPNNNSFADDDQDAVCFSVEDYFYKGDEFTTVLPIGYDKITWTRKVGVLGAKVPVTASTSGVTILPDGNLKITDITAYTEFEFQASNKNCPVSGCCPIKYVPGPLGSIGDFVFTDTNKDGIQSLGELGLVGVKVQLYKSDGLTLLEEVTTDLNGKYLFDSLETGSYKVKFILPSGSTFTDTGKGTTATDSDAGLDGFSGIINIDVEKTGIDKDNLTIDAGVIGNLGSIGDFVFRDDNSNGVQDAGEPGIKDVVVNLYKGATLLATTKTDADGKYNFPGLSSGTDYQVEFVAPAQSKFTTPLLGGNATKDSDAGVGGKSGFITIDVTKPATDILRNNPTIDAGIVPLGSIGDYVFNDNNNDGIQNSGDTPLAGVKVYLLDKNMVKIDSTNTKPDGSYNFNVPSGEYFIQFTKTNGQSFSQTGKGLPSTDSDADAITGKSGKVTIDATKPIGDPARNNKDIDAGVVGNLGSIGDFVFVDSNGNNRQDTGEPGIAGVTVELYTSTGTTPIKSFVTLADGKYLFTDLASGDYKVKFVLPTGKTFITPNATGSTTANDSDAGTGGVSGIINIDVTKPLGDIGRNNLTIDAGVKADCNINPGTLATATPNFCLPNGGSATLVATVATAPTVPVGYLTRYVLTKGSDLVIQQVSTTPSFTVTGTGEYRIHTLVYDGNSANGSFLDLSVVVLGTTKGGDVVGIINDKKLCAALDVTGVKFNINSSPVTGTLTTTTPNVCLPETGSVVLTATVGTSPVVPTGYSLKYVLTKGSDLVIQQVSNAPTFTVTAATTGEYRIHTLIFDGNPANSNFLDLSVVVLGTTKGGDVVGIINDKKLCAALDVTGVKFNINPVPVAPVFVAKTICAGEKVTIGDVGPPSTGVSYAWFESATATTSFATTKSIEVSPTVTTTYYVESTVVAPGSCPSKRGSVVVTVNPKPENPVAKSTLGNDCTKNLQTVNLADAITTTPAGSVIEWHIANDVASAIITNTATAGAGTYYAFAKSTAGCYSGGVAVTVTITPCSCQNPATVSVAPIAAVCGNTSTIIQLGATIGGGATSGTWTSNGTGTYDNATSLTAKYTPSAADVAKGSVEFTFTTNDPDGAADPKCIAASAKATLTFKAKPIPPTNLRCEPVICLGDSNKLFSVSQGNVVKWYATATSTTSLGTATDAGFVIAPSPEGTYTYFAEATTPEGCVSERASISFIVKKCLTDLAVIKTVNTPDVITAPDYLLGQTFTYSINAQNIGDANATDVKVNDILPAGVTFVNASPSGQYNSTTGVWTIGNLNKGSNAVLLIQVTSNKIGAISNTATISSSNEDPTKLANNTSKVDIKVVEIADLSLTKTVNKSVVSLGDEIEYTITVLNAGPNAATNVEITDKLPAGLTYVSSSTLTENAGVLTGKAANIAKGALATFTFKAKVDKEGKITNLAEVSKSDQKDPDSTPGNASTKPGEDDDDSVDINSTFTCNIEKPTIACGCTQKTICLGGETTLTASGCVGSSYVWNNGATTSSITVSPKTNQTYTVFCQKDKCKSESSNAVEVKVIVVDSPLLSAAPSKICAGESTTLTASGCSGVVEWQTSPKQTGPQITVKPAATQTYKAVCKEFECTSALASVEVIVTPTPNAPEIVCGKGEICPGETIAMTALNCSGQVKWSTGQETTTITVFPTVTTSYTVTCSVNGCTSGDSKPFVLTVKPIAIPVIKTNDLIVCTGGTATLTAEGCTGKVTWTFGDKTSTGATIIVKPTTTTTYYATCSSIACTSDKSLPATVQVVNPAPPIVSSGTSTICANSSVELTATGCENGTVNWSDGQKGAVVTVKPLVSTSYTATCSIGSCVSDASIKRNITVTDFAKPTITADKLIVCLGESVKLTANGCNGTVKWSDGITGSPRTVTPTADVKYTATCESTTCKSDVSNELAIKVNSAGPAPVISCPKTEICAGESVTLSATGCTGTVKWSDGSIGTTVTLKPLATTVYSAKCVTNTCESVNSNEKTITVNPAVVLNLKIFIGGSDKVCSGTPVTLFVQGCPKANITWTGGFKGDSLKVKPTETTTYTATCSGVACATDASASVKITILPGATTPNITPTNTQICAGVDVTLTANNCNGALLWSSGQTTASITVKPTVTTIYSVKCTVDGCGEAKTSEPVTVKVGTPDAPTVTSVPPSVCAGGTVVLTAVGCTAGIVQWSNGKTGATLTETVNATTVYSAVCKQGTCNSPESNKVTVTVTIPSVPTISCATSTICAGSTITLIASGCEGTVNWSDGQVGAIVTATLTKTTDYTATCTVGTCKSASSSVATVNVGNPPAPSITCTATSICQGIQVTLTATNCTGTVVWNDGQVGNVITAKPNATTKYFAICKLDKCESGKSNEITISVGAGIATPKTKNLNNVCPFLTVDLASGVTSTLSAGGTFEYHTGILPTSPLVSNPNAAGTGTYYVFEKTGTGCYSSPAVINTFINPDCTPKDCAKTPAIASAGTDATICAEKIYKLAGTFGGAATSITWKTTGSGSFDNPLNPTATYRSSLADVLAGTVKLIICTNDPDGNGPCKAAADTMTLTMNGVKFKPLVAVTGNLNACGLDSVTLTATAGTYGYKWFKVGTTTEIASTRSITVKSSGGYFFKLVDANKCCSIESDTATVNLLPIPNAPIANSVKIDRGTTVDLTKLVVSNTPAGATLVFKTGAASSATTVSNPSAVGAGIYYACYKSAQGCFSLSTKITVENKGTVPTSTDSDIQITVSTENNLALDGTVKVTITVKNNGPATGKDIVVTSPIPTGLTYVSQTGGLVKTDLLLNGKLDSLISGGVKVYTWVGKISGTTTSVTVGATSTSTSPDPNPSNNNGSNPNGNVTVSVPPANSSDIVVTITTDKVNYAVGDTVTTTIKITNLGPATAKNVTVSSTVPDLLRYVSQTGGLVINGKVLTGKLDSLVRNGMVTYTYKSVLTGTGPVVITGTGTSNNPDPNPNNNNGTGTNGSVTINPTVIQGADVVITVTTDKTTYALGDIVTTTITVKNLGPQTAKGINVSSTLPSILEYIAQTGGLVKTGNVFTGTIDSLVKDGVKVYTYTAKVTGNGTGTITATGTSTTTDPNPSNNNGTGTGGSVTITGGTPIVLGADVVITVTTDKTTYAIGDIVTTTITVKNLGPQTAKGINVSSTLPSILEYIAQTGGLVKTGNVFTGTLDSLVKDGVKVYTYTAKVTGNGTGTITATGTSTTTDPNPNNNNGTGTGGSVTITGGTLPPGSGADVVITITTNKPTYAVGDTVTTTIKVTNLGPDVAKGINVFSVIPGTLTYVSQTGGLVKVGNLLTATIPSLDKDGVVTYTYKSVLNTKSETVIAAGGTATTKDPNPSNNNGTGTGTATINKGDVDPTVADVAIVITADKTKAKVGEDVNFILTLTNNGPATAKNVVFVNPIPAGLTFVSSSTGEVLTSGAISRTLDSLQKGQVRTYAYVAKMNVKTDVTNTVSVGSFKDNVGPNNFSFVTINGDTTSIPVPKDGAELAILLTADKQLIAKDDEVTFTIKLTNNGPKTATNVVIDNVLPKFLTFVSGDPAKVGDTLRTTTASLANGAMITYTYKAKVNKDTIIRNTARITKTSPVDSILTNNVSTVVLVPASDTTYADLAVLIAADKATYKVGDDVTYTVTLTNNGAGRAKDVQLCNPTPKGLTYVSGTGVIRAGDSVTIKVDTISRGRTRTFTYIAKATTAGTIANTVRICNSSKLDLITPNNTSISTIKVDTSDRPQPQACRVTLAMAIIDTAKVSDGMYNVTYRLIARNICKDTLKNVSLTNDLAKTFKTPLPLATYSVVGKPSLGIKTNLIPNDTYSATDSSLVKVGSYMLPNAIDTIKYTIKVTLNGNKGPFVSNATITGKTAPGNETLTAKAREVLRFDLPNTRIGVAKEVVTTALKNDSTTFWTVKYRIRIVNLGANAITNLSVRDSLGLVFVSKGVKIIGKPELLPSQGLTVNPNYTGVGKGDSTELLIPDKSTLGILDSARIGIIDLTVRVNTAGSTDPDNIFNNVAVGTGTGTDKLTYRDISTRGVNPDPDGDKDPSNNSEATPVTLKGTLPQLQVSIGIALRAVVTDSTLQADSTCNVVLTMTAKNYGKDNLKNVRLCTNLENTIGKQSESWTLVAAPRVLRGNAKISTTFDGKADSTVTKTDSTFLAVGDSIVISYLVKIKRPSKDTITTFAIAKAVSAVDATKSTSDISTNGLNPDVNGDGRPDELVKTPIICKGAVDNTTAFIPQGFSPNGDGTNDAFKINGLKDTELNELIIFNRWGGVVYASGDYKNDWTGQSNQGIVAIGAGQGLPDGTYFYCFTRYAKNTDGTKGDKVAPEKINSITLIR